MRTAVVPHALRRSHEQEHLDTPNNVELTHTRSTSRRKKTYSRQPDDAARAQKTPRSSSAKKTGEKTETRANNEQVRAPRAAPLSLPLTPFHTPPTPSRANRDGPPLPRPASTLERRGQARRKGKSPLSREERWQRPPSSLGFRLEKASDRDFKRQAK